MKDYLTAYNLDNVLVGVLGHEFSNNKLIIKLDCKTSSEDEGKQENITVTLTIDESSQFLLSNYVIFTYLLDNSLLDLFQLLKNPHFENNYQKIEKVFLRKTFINKIINTLDVKKQIRSI
jgi:hypothetical protein